nr:GNAT family N-acetyltransferase [Shimazuella soli]
MEELRKFTLSGENGLQITPYSPELSQRFISLYSEKISGWYHHADIYPTLESHFKLALEEMENGTRLPVFFLKNGVLIGFCSISTISVYHERGILSGLVLHPEYRGKKYSKQLVGLLLGWIFEDVGFHSLQVKVVTTNLPSLKLMKSLGFEGGTDVQAESVRCQYWDNCPEGGWHDLTNFSLLAKKFLDQ